MDAEKLAAWLPPAEQAQLVEQAIGLVGVTRVRAECWIRLWVYLLVKEQLATQPRLQPPLVKLTIPTTAISCTHREAADFLSRSRAGKRSSGWDDAR
jgi:hypothetical protein